MRFRITAAVDRRLNNCGNYDFSMDVQELEYFTPYRLFSAECGGKTFTLTAYDVVAIMPETVEDTVFLEDLRKEVLSHSKILLANVDAGLWNEDVEGEEFGFYAFEGENITKVALDDSIWKRKMFHYLVSEIVKEEGIPYMEISVALNDDKEEYTLGLGEGRTREVLLTTYDYKGLLKTAGTFLRENL